MATLRRGLAAGIAWLLLAAGSAAAAAGGFVRIEAPADGLVSYRDRIAVIARGFPGAPMTLWVNGEAVDTLTVRADMKADFLNVSVPPGPVAVAVTQAAPGGGAVADSVGIHVVGPAARVLLEVSPGTLPADSLSQAEARLQVVDAWGVPLPDGIVVTARLDRGAILTPDLYPEQLGVQVQVRHGQAVLRLLSAGSAGEGRLEVAADDARAEAVLAYTTPLARWQVAGLASGQVGYRQTRRPPAGVDPGAAFGRGKYADGRLAAYTRGTVGGAILVTGSYDSDRKYTDQVFRYLTPERVYPIYGDASSVFYETPSASKLFLRAERNRSYVQYGDFATALSAAELSAYRRSFTGLSSRLDDGTRSASLFGAATEQGIQVDEIPGEGVSGLYYLSAGRRGALVVAGSERVVIQTRARLHPEIVVKEDPQFRFTDYEIDYEAGTLLFKRPVPRYRADESPVVIVVTYETSRATTRQLVGGGRLELRASERGHVGVTAIGEERPANDYWLTGVDGQWRVLGDADLVAEVARSTAATTGWAWKVGTRGRLLEALHYDLYYREAQRDFANPSVTTVPAGARKLRGRLGWTGWRRTTLGLEAFLDDDAVNDRARTSARLEQTHARGTVTQKGAIEFVETDTRGTTLQSTILNAGLAWQARPNLSLEAERDQAFGDEDIAYRPTLNRLRARVQISQHIDLVGEHAFRNLSPLDSSFTAVGLQSRLSDDLTAYGNYRLDNGVNGQTNQALVGLRHRQRLRPDLTVHGAFERVSTLRGNAAGDYYAVTLATEYLPTAPLKASARLENREGRTMDKRLASVAGDWTLGGGLSCLARHTYLREVQPTGGTREHRLASGLAYRPLRHDRANLLAKYEYRQRENTLIAPAVDQAAHIGSVETLLEPWSQVEWFGRYAAKLASLRSLGRRDRALTDLWLTNLRLEWRARWDLLGEYRLLTQHAADDRRQGAAVELGFIVPRNARLAVGYNFAGYQDDDLAGVSYWARGPYLKVQLKYTEADVAGWLDGLQSRLPGGRR